MRTGRRQGEKRLRAPQLLDQQAPAAAEDMTREFRDRFLTPEDFDHLNSFQPDGFDSVGLARHVILMDILYPDRHDDIPRGAEVVRTVQPPAQALGRIQERLADRLARAEMITVTEADIECITMTAVHTPEHVEGVVLTPAWEAGSRAIDEHIKIGQWVHALPVMMNLALLFPGRHRELAARINESAAEAIQAEVKKYFDMSGGGFTSAIRIAAIAHLFDQDRPSEYYYTPQQREKMERILPQWVRSLRENRRDKKSGPQTITEEFAYRSMLDARRVVVAPDRRILLNPPEDSVSTPELPARVA